MIIMSKNYQPDDREDVDREIRIEKLKYELDQIAGGSMFSGGFGDLPPAIEERFLESARRFEAAELDTTFNRLLQRGVVLEPPSELDEASLSTKLAKLLRVLATMRCFIADTDHLSDRELYTWLWTDGLREEIPNIEEIGGAWHTSPIGAANDEDMQVFLKYYATEEERRHWHERFPHDTLPSHEPRPFDRDANLPRPR
jgi:hypothetical protein